MTPELNFEDVSSARLDDEAAALVEAGTVQLFYVKNDLVSSLRIDGPCPRCGHSFSQTRALELPVTSIRGTPTTHVAAATWADFICDCTVAHPGAPSGARGCGASYALVQPTTTGE
ncbi:hypothetical protein SCMU_29480 [Sinomonas cyclohexanicum]|uniref:Uncharacterized protein n=1 Tax=Sinomonas cyclohexanicum TaxID=322009 RepID=A0ABM7PYG8_SINCY|nr:hypothetical protein SCMU_29480 [Corynebacterium cyclohexanicum]